MACAICLGEGWVCENHPDQPWNEGEPACCGGAGSPCSACNTERPPRFAPGTTVLWKQGQPIEDLLALMQKKK